MYSLKSSRGYFEVVCNLDQPLRASELPLALLLHCDEADERPVISGDHHLFSADRLFDQLGKMLLRLQSSIRDIRQFLQQRL